MSEITAKLLEKVLTMLRQLPPSRFYTLAAIFALGMVGFLIRCIAELVAALH